jgi:hypothetical protein
MPKSARFVVKNDVVSGSPPPLNGWGNATQEMDSTALGGRPRL